MLNVIDKLINFLGLKKLFYNFYFVYYYMETYDNAIQHSNAITTIPKWDMLQTYKIEETLRQERNVKNLVIENMTRL